MNRPLIGAGYPSTGAVANCRTIVGILTAALACAAICCIAQADASAANTVDHAGTSDAAAPPGAVTCDAGRGPKRPAGVSPFANVSFLSDTAGERDRADLSIWRTITLGGYNDAGALRRALAAADCRVGDVAEQVLRTVDFPVRNASTSVHLVIASLADLGFTGGGASLDAIYERAAQLGLTFCDAEIGPQLRLQYPAQPAGEFLRIAMRPLEADDGRFVDLRVANGGAGLLLIAGKVATDRAVPPTTRFVFIAGQAADVGHPRHRMGKLTSERP